MEKIKKALEKAGSTRSDNRKINTWQRNVSLKGQRNTIPAITYEYTQKIEPQIDHLRKYCILTGEENDHISDAYKVLRTQILHNMRDNNWNSVAITSPTSGNGKTVTAINLAISLSKVVNQTVLLVDLDLRNPKVGKYFTSNELLGISDYLNENKKISEILFNPSIERLVVLPGNKTYTNSSEMLSSPKMQDLVEELKSFYKSRIVIFDLPPVLSCDDVIAFTPSVDSIILVIEDEKNKIEELKNAYQLLDKNKLIGTVLNKSFEKNSVYSY